MTYSIKIKLNPKPTHPIKTTHSLKNPIALLSLVHLYLPLCSSLNWISARLSLLEATAFVCMAQNFVNWTNVVVLQSQERYNYTNGFVPNLPVKYTNIWCSNVQWVKEKTNNNKKWSLVMYRKRLDKILKAVTWSLFSAWSLTHFGHWTDWIPPHHHSFGECP